MCRNECHICFCNLIRDEGKIKKETSKNVEKLKDQLLKTWYSRNEIIDDHEKVIDQENHSKETWKEKVDKERVSHDELVGNTTN